MPAKRIGFLIFIVVQKRADPFLDRDRFRLDYIHDGVPFPLHHHRPCGGEGRAQAAQGVRPRGRRVGEQCGGGGGARGREVVGAREDLSIEQDQRFKAYARS